MNKFLGIFFFFIVSCGPVEEINFSTPSGKPEVLVQNSNPSIFSKMQIMTFKSEELPKMPLAGFQHYPLVSFFSYQPFVSPKVSSFL